MGVESTNNIDIVVSDKGVAETQTRVIALADAADKAEGSIGRLKASLADIKAGGLASLKAALADTQSGTVSLRNEAASLSSQQRQSSTDSAAAAGALRQQKQAAAELALAYHDAVIENRAYAAQARLTASQGVSADRELAASINEVTLALERQLDASAAAANTAYLSGKLEAEQADLAAINEITAALEAQLSVQAEQQALAASNANAARLQQERVAAQELALAYHDAVIENRTFNAQLKVDAAESAAADRELMAAINQVTSALEKQIKTQGELSEAQQLARVGTLEAAEATNVLTAATTRSISPNIAAAGTIGLLEGRTMSFSRVLANFLTKTVGLGGFFEAIFPLIGAVAAVAVIGMVYSAWDKWYKKSLDTANQLRKGFEEIIDPLRKQNDELEVTNLKLEAANDKLEHKPSTVGTRLAIAEITAEVDKLGAHLTTALDSLDKLLSKNRIGSLSSFITNQGATGDTEKLIRAQFDSVKKAQQDAQNNIDSASGRGDAKGAQAALSAGQTDIQNKVRAATEALNAQYNSLSKINGISKQAVVSYTDLGEAIMGVKKTENQTANLTSLGESVTLLREVGRDQNLIYNNAALVTTNARLKDLKSTTDLATSAAKAEWKSVLDQFTKYKLAIEQTGRATTAEDQLAFFQDARPKLKYPSQNDPKADAEISAAQNKILQQTFVPDQIQKLKDQAGEMGLYADQLREAAMLTKILDEASAKHITVTDAQKVSMQGYIATIVEGNPAQRDLTNLVKSSGDEIRRHTAYQDEANNAAKMYPQFSEQIARAVVKEGEAYKSAVDPLYQFNKGIDDQLALSGEYGQRREIDSQLQQLYNTQLAAGNRLDTEQLRIAREKLQSVSDSNEKQAAENALYYDKVEALRQLQVQQRAILDLTGQGKLNADQSARAQIKNTAGQNEINDEQGKGKNSDYVTSMLAAYVKLESMGMQVRDTLKQAFSALADGVADTLARALVTGKGLWEGLKDAGKQALEALLSGLLKIAIQLLVVEVLSKAFHINLQQGGDTSKTTLTNTAAGIAAIAATTLATLAAINILQGPAWSLAEAVSLFTFGANAITATTGIASVVAAGQAAQHFAYGGVVQGMGGTDSVPAWMTPGEGVLTKSGLSRLGGPGTLSALNSGSSIQTGARSATDRPGSSTTSASAPSAPRLVIEDHTSGIKLIPVGASHDEVRVIARDVVRSDADSVIGDAMNNSNSNTRKSMHQNTTATPRRG